MSQNKEIDESIQLMAQKAKKAARTLISLSTETKNNLLRQMAEALEEKRPFIQQQNQKDLLAGQKKGLSAAMLDRLELSDKVMASMISGLLEVAALPDPVGEVLNLSKRPNGLMVGRMRIPLGVIGMIYESRPNVTVDAAALCLKAGNAIILRGGSEAIHSNLALAEVLQGVLAARNIDPAAIQVIPVTDRAAVTTLLAQEKFIDLIIPRGGEGLIRFVSETSRIPVLKHYKGVCHIFVDSSADLLKASPVIMNSKTQRPGVCNALEGLLIHRDIAASYLPVIAEELRLAGVELRGCAESVALASTIKLASAADWGTEFLDLVLCMKVIGSLDEAMTYMAEYGSQHTEVIITEDYSNAQRFLAEVDASAVMVNASTRFNDGGQLGLGAEIGISTTKLHAYGPMGLSELTTKKFIIYGAGQVRS
ncbi:MAG: glutamate-5-semialdehyde dehydrogenase [Proteobacteria bacterium]|jgi:glutamate-5-semialdehyde dehydrogenase|nr:glutamate-5-semialdehyde dehydrogenase [Desulfocapsa sp.]MBU3943927.1 glutamate-5-semialdehyde dehydrogenase [Pseudomonadota bacterium]MCG2742913.1 glutamate-5-semialdehyde dehydrogenase [Desulfobacteraceae bacterium]MBU4027936.1 glutamate-5-semialdehyde dehydrogenase [Pseudomonadota bacterium]MBU4042422.1 glutamate-5-semialdehyde dehydrogenase [Pseudomonadota bacterium]